VGRFPLTDDDPVNKNRPQGRNTMFHSATAHDAIDLELEEMRRTVWHNAGHTTAAARDRAARRALRAMRPVRKKR
jgi:hypothetical protein